MTNEQLLSPPHPPHPFRKIQGRLGYFHHTVASLGEINATLKRRDLSQIRANTGRDLFLDLAAGW